MRRTCCHYSKGSQSNYLTSDKADFRKGVLSGIKSTSCVIRLSILPTTKNLTVPKKYVPNNKISKSMRQKLIRCLCDTYKFAYARWHRRIQSCGWRLQPASSRMWSIKRGESQKECGDPNSTISQFDLLITYRILHLTAECTFLSSSHEIFPMVGHILDHKTHLNKSKRREIIQIMFSGYNKIKLEFHKRNIAEKPKNIERF